MQMKWKGPIRTSFKLQCIHEQIDFLNGPQCLHAMLFYNVHNHSVPSVWLSSLSLVKNNQIYVTRFVSM